MQEHQTSHIEPFGLTQSDLHTLSVGFFFCRMAAVSSTVRTPSEGGVLLDDTKPPCAARQEGVKRLMMQRTVQHDRAVKLSAAKELWKPNRLRRVTHPFQMGRDSSVQMCSDAHHRVTMDSDRTAREKVVSFMASLQKANPQNLRVLGVFSWCGWRDLNPILLVLTGTSLSFFVDI